MSVCRELKVVVPVPVLPGGVPGCTVVLVADIGDVRSRSLTGSLGASWGAGLLAAWCPRHQKPFWISALASFKL